MASEAITRNDLTEILNAVLPSTAVDYVVEEGTSGMWTYRKWNSGIAECWGAESNKTVAVNSTYGHGYYGSLQTITYPSGLFSSVPVPTITLAGGDGLWAGISSQGTASISYYPFAVQNGNHTFAERIFAIGKWK